MTREQFDQMDEVTSAEAMHQLQMAVAVITRKLIAEGFPQEVIAEYLHQNIDWTLGDVLDDLA